MPKTRAAAVGDVEDIGARMTELVIARVTAHLSAKIDQAFAEVEERLRAQDGRLDDLAGTVRVAAATVTKMVADLAESTRLTDTPAALPAALDAACAAAPGAGPQRVELDVHGRHVVEFVQPGDDPTAVWTDVCAAVTSRRHAGAGAWQS